MARIVLAFAIVLAGCQPVASEEPQPSVELNRVPDGLACDAVGIPFRLMTFDVDPAIPGVVTAVTDAGDQLNTYWREGFALGVDGRSIVDPAGQRVVTDGEVLVVPQNDWPRLIGYMVCPAPGKLYILLPDQG
jgi:hypothetical protein